MSDDMDDLAELVASRFVMLAGGEILVEKSDTGEQHSLSQRDIAGIIGAGLRFAKASYREEEVGREWSQLQGQRAGRVDTKKRKQLMSKYRRFGVNGSK